MNIRQYFRFSLKDLMWLMLLAACNLGWYANKVTPVKALEKKIGEQHWEIEFHKNQVAIERKAMKEYDEHFLSMSQRSFKFERENDALEEMLTPNQKQSFAKWKQNRDDEQEKALKTANEPRQRFRQINDEDKQ